MAKALSWLLVIALVVGIGAWVSHLRRRIQERRHAEEARMADFMAQAMGRPAAAAIPAVAVPAAAPRTAPAPAAAAPDEGLAQQKLLLDAADKAAEAGEPALSIQLYARLVARYPQGALAARARAAAEMQKKKLAIARGPGSAAPG